MRRRWMVILVLAVAACGDDAPADVAGTPTIAGTPSTAGSASTAAAPSTQASAVVPDGVPGVVPQGFGTIAAHVTASNGEICELCLWLADDSGTRGRGLMQVTDLDGLDGMAFRYDSPHTTSFTMRNTLMPLSIAFFGADGAYLDGFDMDPCAGEPCPSYPTPADFVIAVEVPQGELAELGIGAGSTLELLAEGCSGAASGTP